MQPPDLPALLALVAAALSTRSSAIWELHPESGALVLAAAVGWPDPANGSALLGTASSALNAFLIKGRTRPNWC